MTQKAIDIVKRSGKRPSEPYDRTKLYRSIIAVCRSVRSTEGAAETAATYVCDAVTVWLEKRPEVTSEDVRRIAARHLAQHNSDAAYLYRQHNHII